MPHAVQQLGELGIADALLARGIETREVCFYTSNGQLVDQHLIQALSAFLGPLPQYPVYLARNSANGVLYGRQLPHTYTIPMLYTAIARRGSNV